MATDVYSLLRKRYPENGYALMQEVSDAAGFNRSRSADYIVMSLWPSRGLELSGIELKSFRSDWLSELKNPEKAENIYKYCDTFWLLTTDDTIAKIEEIPITWGWMCIKGSRIIVKKEAPKLTPQPITRNFLAAMLKRAESKSGFIRVSEIQDKIDTSVQNTNDINKKALERTQSELKSLTEKVKTFSKESGIDFHNAYTWGNHTIENMGKAVKFINDGGAESVKKDLLRLQQISNDINNKISTGLTDLSTLQLSNLPTENKE